MTNSKWTTALEQTVRFWINNKLTSEVTSLSVNFVWLLQYIHLKHLDKYLKKTFASFIKETFTIRIHSWCLHLWFQEICMKGTVPLSLERLRYRALLVSTLVSNRKCWQCRTQEWNWGDVILSTNFMNKCRILTLFQKQNNSF